jgi:hypothetical protein
MNRGIIHKLPSKARKYLKKVNVPEKKLMKSLSGD